MLLVRSVLVREFRTLGSVIAMRQDDFALLIMEHIESSIRGISRLFRILVSRLSENREENISKQISSLDSKVDDNNRKLQTLIYSIQGRHARSPSCVTLDDTSDEFLLEP